MPACCHVHVVHVCYTITDNRTVTQVLSTYDFRYEMSIFLAQLLLGTAAMTLLFAAGTY